MSCIFKGIEMYTRQSFWEHGVSEMVIIELRLWRKASNLRAQSLTGHQFDKHVQSTMKRLITRDGSLR